MPATHCHRTAVEGTAAAKGTAAAAAEVTAAAEEEEGADEGAGARGLRASSARPARDVVSAAAAGGGRRSAAECGGSTLPRTPPCARSGGEEEEERGEAVAEERRAISWARMAESVGIWHSSSCKHSVGTRAGAALPLLVDVSSSSSSSSPSTLPMLASSRLAPRHGRCLDAQEDALVSSSASSSCSRATGSGSLHTEW
jgi:hypothetical protein